METKKMSAMFSKLFLLFVLVILSISKIEGKRNSHGSSSHSSSHSSSGSHHSTGSHHVGHGNTHHGSGIGHGTSHPTGGFGTGSTHHTGSSGIGFGGSHTLQHNGGLSSTHTVTGGIGFTNQGGPVHPTHINPVGVSHQSAPNGTPTRPIGFTHLNNQHSTSGDAANHGGTIPHTTNNIYVTNTHITNTHHENVVHHPYQPHTVVIPGGGIQYHPPVQLQYVPPVHTVHVIPIQSYPSVVYTSGVGYDHGTSFLSGFLIGRVSGMLDNNNNHQSSVVHHYDSTDHNSNQQQTNNYYTVHNYYQNRENVPTTFSIPGVNAVECPSNTSESLCVPNTNAICLKNETIMCVTNSLLTVPCGPNDTLHCVYTKIECNGDPSCNTTANQTYIDFYVPCVANITLFNNIVVDTEKHDVQGNYELCVTAIAEPKKLQKPV